MEDSPWIQTEQLSKSYGTVHALRDVSLGVGPGEILGLLGPNGAGKTTTLRILMGMLVPSSGRAYIRGLDCTEKRAEVKRHVGFLPDAPDFYDYLTARELLRFFGSMHGMPRSQVEERAELLLSELALTEAAGDFVSNYSLGMKKKVGLALALMHDPEVLILDEPTTGLDPRAARHVRELIQDYAKSGRSVLLSTHQLSMAERYCTTVAILDRGRLVGAGAPDELRERLGANRSLEDVFLAVTHEGS